MLAKHWDDLVSVVGDRRMPKLTEHTAKKLTAMEYGSGHYGTVLPTETDGLVAKITSDPTEAQFVAVLLETRDEYPRGLVRYHAAVQLTGSHRNRPIYILWRDEAFHIGRWFPIISRATSSAEVNRFLARLDQFNALAKAVHYSFVKTSNLSKLRRDVMRSYEQYRGNVYFESTHLTPVTDAIARRKGHDRAGFAIAGCESIADDMTSERAGYKIGLCFQDMFEMDIVLADAHTNNIGMSRDDDSSPNNLLVTDPGHAVFLTAKYDSYKPVHILDAKPGSFV